MELGRCVRGPWKDGAREWLLVGTAAKGDEDFERLQQAQSWVNRAEWCGVGTGRLLLEDWDKQIDGEGGKVFWHVWALLIEFDREYQGRAFPKEFAEVLGTPRSIEDVSDVRISHLMNWDER